MLREWPPARECRFEDQVCDPGGNAQGEESVEGCPPGLPWERGHNPRYAEPQFAFGCRGREFPEKHVVITLGLPGHSPDQEMVKSCNPFGAFAQEASHPITLTLAGAAQLPWLR
ncbi:hypothetical protein D3C73_1075100 [compost metagenome]